MNKCPSCPLFAIVLLLCAAGCGQRNVAGVYVFKSTNDGVTFTCDLRAGGACFLKIQPPRGAFPNWIFTPGPGAIPGQAVLPEDPLPPDGRKGDWKLRGHRVLLFLDGSEQYAFKIDGRDLIHPDGVRYVRIR